MLAYVACHRAKLHSTNPLERLNKEVKRRSDVVGIFPNEDSITRLVGAVLLEANDDWQLQHRYIQIEGMADLDAPQLEEGSALQITSAAAWAGAALALLGAAAAFWLVERDGEADPQGNIR